MNLATVLTRAATGVDTARVAVEVHLANGLPAFNLVGLPDAEVREARERVRAAILTAGLEFPPRRITVNLAPADLPKSGGRFDLPIAVGLLAASGQVPPSVLADHEFHGELGLDASVRPVRGVLAAALAARREGRRVVVPRANAHEALRVGAQTVPIASLAELVAWLRGKREPAPLPPLEEAPPRPGPDLAEVKGQAGARRALEIAAAGGHSLLLYGPPGTGKSMLAQRLPGLLPPMTEEEAIETAAVWSSDGRFTPQHWRVRPFRAPHHSASPAAIVGGVGGGGAVRPGEISLAHGGVLFLDELPEFERRVLEALREPLETGRVAVARVKERVEYPARFQLVAAMNPCPCGYLGDPSGRCRCTPAQIERYHAKLSGPLLDRIDLWVEVPRLLPETLAAAAPGESSAQVRARVLAARERQLARQGKENARLSGSELETHGRAGEPALALLGRAMARLDLSARAYHRILRLARTIADLAGHETIEPVHVAEAVQLRRLPF